MSEPGARMVAPGVISTGQASDELQPAISPEGRELYFVRRSPGGVFTIHVSRRSGAGPWEEARVAPFSGNHADQEPFVSMDGRRLYFTSDRPVSPGGETNRGREPWVVERTADGWSAPERLAPELTLSPPDTGLSRFWGQPRGPVEGPGEDLYFWAERPETLGHTDIYRATRDADSFGDPVNVGPPINSERYETGLAFARDGSFVIFGRDEEEGGYGLGDLYVSLRTDDGWSEPRNLGPLVNSAGFDSSPVVTPDGTHLMFSSNRRADGSEPGRHNIYEIPLARLGLADDELGG